MRKLQGTISGSFQKFMPNIRARIAEFENEGVEVLSPRSTKVERVEKGFAYLTGETGTVREIEFSHLNAIARSDFLYVVNPGGYVGPSVVFEIGFATAHSVPIFCEESASELVVREMSTVEPATDRVKATLLAAVLPDIARGANLIELQAYIGKMVRVRGFQDETVRDVVLLLIEEVGELAKAVRRATGLKTDSASLAAGKMIAHELADCLIYLLDIANLSDTNLENALIEKEAINATKIWVRDSE